MKRNNVLVIGVCALIALSSLCFRFDAIFSEDVFDYEWHSATVLRHLQIWHEAGGVPHNFVPPVTYAGQAHKYINNHSSIEVGREGYQDDSGNFYYVSYPPFAYLAPYAIFTLFDIEPNIIALRLFNIFIQFTTAGVLLALLYKATRNIFIGILGYSLYIFCAISLNVHTVNYMSDMCAQLFFALSAYFFYAIISAQKEKRSVAPVLYTLLCGCLALLLYTEWIGIFVCAFVFFYGLWHRKEVFGRIFMLMSAAVTACVAGLILVQYSSVSDIGAFMSVMTDRYANGYVPDLNEVSRASQLKDILLNYTQWFSSIFATVMIFGGIIAAAKLRGVQSTKPGILRGAFPVCLFLTIPVLLHHLVFFDWTAFDIHYFSVLKSSLVFCILVPLLFLKVWSYDFPARKFAVRLFALIMLVLLFAGSVWTYMLSMSSVYDSSISNCTLGKLINERSEADEVIFVTPVSDDRFNGILSSVMVLCAHRNIELYSDREAADMLIEKNGLEKGIIFTFDYKDSDIQFIRSDRITTAQPETYIR